MTGSPSRRGAWAAAAYLVLYGACLAALWRFEGRSPAEPLAVLVIIGGAFSTLAWVLTRGADRRVVPVRSPARELSLALSLLAALAAWLVVGTAPVRARFADST